MEKEHIKFAMLRQEQTFRQQVNQVANQMLAQRQEQFLSVLPSSLPSGSRAALVYRVQKQLMMQMQLNEMNHRSKASTDVQARSTMKMDGNPEKATIKDFDLELTLATGVGKQEKPTNSDSEATMSPSTSAESESRRQFIPDSNVTQRFQNESNRHDDPVMQPPWLYQCLSLKMVLQNQNQGGSLFPTPM